MKILNVCKPDLLKKDKIFNDYINRLISIKGINVFDIYNFNDWAINSLYMYEYDCLNINKEEVFKKRKELIVTAKGYDVIYSKDKALLLLLDINNNYNMFDLFKEFKKSFRKEYVYGKEASYIRFLNEKDMDFFNRFDKDTLKRIKAKVISYKKELDNIPDYYYMIFFNMIHFPVSYDENNYELNVLNNRVINSNNLVRRLVL